MSKFNTVSKVPNSGKRLAKTVKKVKLTTGSVGHNVEGQLETLVHGREKDRGVLRKSKYHKKLQSDMNKTMSEEIKDDS